jgi:hypothetical protein
MSANFCRGSLNSQFPLRPHPYQLIFFQPLCFPHEHLSLLRVLTFGTQYNVFCIQNFFTLSMDTDVSLGLDLVIVGYSGEILDTILKFQISQKRGFLSQLVIFFFFK